jgi:hypothetical protein
MPRPLIGETPMTCAERQARYRAAHAAGASAWLDALPDSQQDGATGKALRAIVELDLSELQAIEPPRGFGRD